MGKLKLKSHPLNGTCTTNGLLKRFVCQPIAIMPPPFQFATNYSSFWSTQQKALLMSYKCLLIFLPRGKFNTLSSVYFPWCLLSRVDNSPWNFSPWGQGGEYIFTHREMGKIGESIFPIPHGISMDNGDAENQYSPVPHNGDPWGSTLMMHTVRFPRYLWHWSGNGVDHKKWIF